MRNIVLNTVIGLTLAHMVLYFTLPQDYEYRSVGLGFGSMLIACLCALLWKTKHTLEVEVDLPKWFYPLVTIGWAVDALAWWLGVFGTVS